VSETRACGTVSETRACGTTDDPEVNRVDPRTGCRYNPPFVPLTPD
jgi:hypothetical protein